MRHTRFSFSDPRLPKKLQMARVRLVIDRELTPLQRYVLMAVYYGGRSQSQLAAERGVHRSTICRTLHRAEERLVRFLRY